MRKFEEMGVEIKKKEEEMNKNDNFDKKFKTIKKIH